MNKEVHLIIVWDVAIKYFDTILDEVDSRFIVKDVYEVAWESGVFVDNLIAFYSHSQQHLNARQIKKTFIGKANYCGIAPFKLIIFDDILPKYELRNTSNGKREVNVNVFDLKLYFRKLTGGGHKIHGTDSITEANKDLTLLLGKNVKDFNENHTKAWNEKIKLLKRNITGVKGYASLKEFFYVLNTSVSYVVLRNFENFPDNYFAEKHEDIDLLVSNLNSIVYLTGAQKVFSKRNRVHFTVRIANKNIPFDFRYCGDSYYDKKWENNILETRILKDDIFFIPNNSNLFYTLLYHALVHKHDLAQDYIKNLKLINTKYDISSNLCFDDMKILFSKLTNFMKLNNYQYVVPTDSSVYVNYKPLEGLMTLSIIRKLFLLKVDIIIKLAEIKKLYF